MRFWGVAAMTLNYPLFVDLLHPSLFLSCKLKYLVMEEPVGNGWMVKPCHITNVHKLFTSYKYCGTDPKKLTF